MFPTGSYLNPWFAAGLYCFETLWKLWYIGLGWQASAYGPAAWSAEVWENLYPCSAIPALCFPYMFLSLWTPLTYLFNTPIPMKPTHLLHHDGLKMEAKISCFSFCKCSAVYLVTTTVRVTGNSACLSFLELSFHNCESSGASLYLRI